MEDIGRCCAYSNLLRHNHLLSCRIVQHDMMLERGIYAILQIVGILLTDRTNLRDLFNKSNFKSFNELYDSSEQYFVV